jgi:hypothetical protein
MKMVPLLACAIGVLCPGLALGDKVEISRVQYRYVEPTNPAHHRIYDRLREVGVLQKLAGILRPFRFPRTLTLSVQDCDGSVNASYWRDDITVCYEYFDFMLENAPTETMPRGLTRHDALIGMTLDVLLHETGHAVFDMMEIPFLGREEDAADLFSAYMLLQFKQQESRRLIGGAAFLLKRQVEKGPENPSRLRELAEIHDFPAQRFFNLICMAYGADPEQHKGAIEYGGLPEERAKRCRYEYHRFEWGFWKLIGPHIDRNLFKQVMGKHWFDFDAEKSVPASNVSQENSAGRSKVLR